MVDTAPTAQEFCTPAPGGQETCLINPYLLSQLWLPALVITLMGIGGIVASILGTIILVFLVIHMKDFWGQMHFGEMPTKTYGDHEVKDLFTLVGSAFQEWWYVALYCISMVAIAFHLWHGFESAFQTLGLNHMKYNPVISFVGKAVYQTCCKSRMY